MSFYHLLRLIIRGWWHDRLFTVVSWGSLVIGILCASLLGTFVLHEYNIHADVPDGNRILRLTQSVSMGKKAESSFIYGPDVPRIVAAFPEIETALRTRVRDNIQAVYRNESLPIGKFMQADSTFLMFFPLETVAGNLHETLIRTDALALEEATAVRIFGSTDCVGEVLKITADGNASLMVVGAVFRNPYRGMLPVNVLGGFADASFGESCFIKLREGTDVAAFRRKFSETSLPTVLGEGHLGTLTLQESYFDTDLQDFVLLHRSSVVLAMGGIIALLVLLVACFNYINLGLARLLRQVHTLHIEVFAGASRKDIYRRLFWDTCLLIGFAFLCAFLLMNDVLPLFNRLMAAHLTMEYLLSARVLPWLLSGGVIFAVVPSVYISGRLQSLTESDYRLFYRGKMRRLMVSCFQVGQLVVTMALLSVFFIIHNQLDLVEKDNKRFENVIDVFAEKSWGAPVSSWMDKVSACQEVEAVTLSETGLFEESMAVVGESGKPEDLVWMDIVRGSKSLLDFYRMELVDSAETARLLPTVPHPVIVNETFIKQFVPESDNPVGKPVSHYIPDDSDMEGKTIVGVIRDFRKRSLGESVWPLLMQVEDVAGSDYQTLSIRVKEGETARFLKRLEQIWTENYPEQPFLYLDIGMILKETNKDVFMLSDMLTFYVIVSLLMTFFGLYSLVRYTIRLRLREIALRKIHGATSGHLLKLLLSPYLICLVAAFVITVPSVYAFMLSWLEQFAYSVPISAMDFVLPLLVTSGITLLTVVENVYKAVKMNPSEVIKIE